MKHRLKISDSIGYFPDGEVHKVMYWAEIHISPIRLRTETGYIRVKGLVS